MAIDNIKAYSHLTDEDIRDLLAVTLHLLRLLWIQRVTGHQLHRARQIMEGHHTLIAGGCRVGQGYWGAHCLRVCLSLWGGVGGGNDLGNKKAAPQPLRGGAARLLDLVRV